MAARPCYSVLTHKLQNKFDEQLFFILKEKYFHLIFVSLYMCFYNVCVCVYTRSYWHRTLYIYI